MSISTGSRRTPARWAPQLFRSVMQTEDGARLLSFEPLAAGSKVTASILGSKIAFALGVPGRHLALNAIAALAAVKLMGADLEAAAEALANFEAPEGRGAARPIRNAGRSGPDYRRDVQCQSGVDGRSASGSGRHLQG